VYCSRCKEHRAARKVVRFCRAHLPQVLVLSLKRFEFRDVSGVTGFQGSAHREKIDAFVDFPVDGLDLAPFCQDAADSGGSGGGGGDAAGQDGAEGEGTVYDLFAVCNHYGRMGFGHYTAAARDWEGSGLSAQWFSYDDNDVSGPCSPEEVEAEVHSRDAYILFYRRRGSPLTID
jgi:ubiquitin C-terminal hydrolase